MSIGQARAAADLAAGEILATVELHAPPELVFRALTSADAIVDWWVRPGVFDTREWTGDLRPGGAWRAAGVGNGRPYVLEGEFLEIDPPRRIAHTWKPAGVPASPTTVTYQLEPVDVGTRITLRHTGFASLQVCAATCIGWETSFERLSESIAAESTSRG